jgi:bifunctional non-homologous end joining protein LigD
MLATLSDERDLGEGWLLEHKLDGERSLAWVRRGGEVALRSRTDKDLTRTYPELVVALAAAGGHDLLVDGEVCAVRGVQALGFEALQQRLGTADPPAALRAAVPVALYAFDLLHLDGHDLRPLPCEARKALLRDVLPAADGLRYVEHARGDSRARYERACAAGWEGLVAKRAAGRYVHGRSREWLKLKCLAEQELVVGGYTEPRGSRVGIGALLVGYHEDGRLRYAGKVGTGFDARTLADLAARLRALEQPSSPFGEPIRPLPAGAHWVRPELVAQVGFAEWTRAGRLRQPRFLGLRDDKAPEEVVRERAG